MSDLELPFRLPESCVRIAGTRTFVHDAVLGRDDTSAAATVTLDVVGEREPLRLRIAEGLLVDTGVAFEWTDDGRLVTSSVELTGRAGAVAVGAVSDGAQAAARPRRGARRAGCCRRRGNRRSGNRRRGNRRRGNRRRGNRRRPGGARRAGGGRGVPGGSCRRE
jgi:hypothetical protein